MKLKDRIHNAMGFLNRDELVSALVRAALCLTFIGISMGWGTATASTPAKEGSVNVRVSPLGLLIGYLNLDVDIKMDEQWTLGPTLSYWSLKISDYNFTNDQIKFEAYSLGTKMECSKTASMSAP